jgi:KUP system potassium uptake protein
MIVWFSTIGLLGAIEVVRSPAIVRALDPRYGIDLILADPGQGVVLAVTGAEALYADMGHFGPAPIRRAWLRFVFPALLLNYFGQGALLLGHPGAIENTFFRLAPDWVVYPPVGLASTATVIASQAVISGAFTLTRQAVQLGYLPRMQVRHTSEETVGQVYVPGMSMMLLVGVVITALGFRSSNALGGAYGIAVTGTMTVDTILAFTFFWLGARWRLWQLIPVFAVFVTVDLSFFGANLLKFAEGGWFPLAIGACIYTVIMTWLWGRARAAAQRASGALPLATLVETLSPDRPVRVPGTAIYMTARVESVPGTAAQYEAQQGPARAKRPDERAHRGCAQSAGDGGAGNPSFWAEFSHRHDPLRLSRGARHPPRLGAVPCRRDALRPDGYLVLCPAREDHRPTSIRHHLALQETLYTSVEYGPRRDRVFQDPGQPDRRVRW